MQAIQTARARCSESFPALFGKATCDIRRRRPRCAHSRRGCAGRTWTVLRPRGPRPMLDVARRRGLRGRGAVLRILAHQPPAGGRRRTHVTWFHTPHSAMLPCNATIPRASAQEHAAPRTLTGVKRNHCSGLVHVVDESNGQAVRTLSCVRTCGARRPARRARCRCRHTGWCGAAWWRSSR
jgi:hypothetical protein